MPGYMDSSIPNFKFMLLTIANINVATSCTVNCTLHRYTVVSCTLLVLVKFELNG